jgi:alkylated DNA nucleotide flippase Atl1
MDESRSRRGGATPSRSHGAAPAPWYRAVEEEGRSKVTPPWTKERERELLLLLLAWERWR